MEREEQIRLARQLLGSGVLSESTCEAIKADFPELAESEDEGIRKEIYGFLNRVLKDKNVLLLVADRIGDGVPNMIPSWIAYLEKQKEQKEQKPIFRVGDAMRTQDEAAKGIKDGLPYVVSIDSEYYICNNEKIRIADQGDYEFPPMNRKQSAEWSEEDERMQNAILQDLANIKAACPKINIQDELDWLKSLRPPFKDKEMKLKILKYLSTRCSSLEFEEVEDYLNNLRPQPHWKPIEEQMRTLIRAQSQCCPTFAKILQSIHDDLKKL